MSLPEPKPPTRAECVREITRCVRAGSKTLSVEYVEAYALLAKQWRKLYKLLPPDPVDEEKK